MTLFCSGLVRYPASPGGPAERISVVVARTNAGVTIRYDVTGDIDMIAFPIPAPPERRDELWQQTCFELFVRAPGEGGYREWNFAPGGAWAAYRFDGYRSGMRNADVVPPAIVTGCTDTLFRMDVTVALDGGPWQIGLSAVIRERDGGPSYWALTHPSDKPDFHHPDCFTVELAPSPNT